MERNKLKKYISILILRMDKTTNTNIKSNNLNSFNNITYKRLIGQSIFNQTCFANLKKYEIDPNTETDPNTNTNTDPNLQTISKKESPECNKPEYNKPKQIKKVKFSDNLETKIIISNSNNYDDYQIINYNYQKYIDKYKNNILKLNLIIRVPIDLINKKNIDLLYFKISDNKQNIYKYIEPFDKFDLYSDYEYDTYELQDINIDLTKMDGLSLKIIYKKHTAFNTSFDNTYHESDTKRKVLSIIYFDYQEIIENYEDGKTVVTFNDNFENIIYKYNLVIY